MGAFDERMKRAARNFSQRSAAEEQAQKALEEKRKDFLLSFRDAGHDVIEPVLRSAQAALVPPAASEWSDNSAKKGDRIGAGVEWSDNDDRLIFTLTPGAKRAVLIFLADPLKMRVRVFTVAADIRNMTEYARLMEARDGAGDNAQAFAELKLEDVNTEVVEKHVTDFVERHLGRG